MDINLTGLDGALAQRSFTGVIAVYADGRRVAERCAGYRHRAHRVPMTVDTRIAVASGSKAFTALAVMRLVDDGRLRLDQPVREMLGADLPLIDAAVTVEHLLTHTSGIGDYLDEDGDWEVSDHVLTVPVHTLTTAEAFLPLLDGHAQRSRPGERFSYCNSGYMIPASSWSGSPATPTTRRSPGSSSNRPGLPGRVSCPSTSSPRMRRSATSMTRATSPTPSTYRSSATPTAEHSPPPTTCTSSGRRSWTDGSSPWTPSPR